MQFARCVAHNHRKRHITIRNGVKVINTNQSELSECVRLVISNCIVLND